MEMASYFQSPTHLLTRDTIRLGVRAGPDTNSRLVS